ncbi:MAG: UDP-N-acetylmuramate dehydrogenase [Methanocella sp.]
MRLNEPMSRHTTMQVGGPAELFVEPAGQEELLRLLGWCRARELTFLLIGEGSNLIVRDGGFPGLVIRVGQGLAKVSVSGRLILAEAGVRLAELARTAAAAGLSGLEFAVGIPGSLGGGLFMNAGAYGGELGGLVRQCKVVTETGEVRCLSGGEMEFGYRHSVLQERPWYALEATLELAPGDPEAIAARMSDLTAQREAKQPLELPSAGSVFRRPEGYYVGKLVEEAGLRGFRIGGAQVSEKHTGFIVNTGGATAGEVVALIRHIQTVVRDRFGVSLEPEARIVGEDLR